MEKLKVFFEQHNIKTKIENGLLFVLNEWFSITGKKHQEWENATDWDNAKALAFLGYELIEE